MKLPRAPYYRCCARANPLTNVVEGWAAASLNPSLQRPMPSRYVKFSAYTGLSARLPFKRLQEFAHAISPANLPYREGLRQPPVYRTA
jgi:hypothetical protein